MTDEMQLAARGILPKGWVKTLPGDSMWSYVFDQWGRERISIFNGQDRGFNRRFKIAGENEGDNDSPRRIIVLDANHSDPVFSTDWVTKPPWGNKETQAAFYRTLGKGRRMARAWLKDHYPDWTDSQAYWDEK